MLRAAAKTEKLSKSDTDIGWKKVICGEDMCLNCSFSVKSTKFGTETVFKMTKKIGYGGKPETAVLPS